MAQESILRIVIDSRNAERNAHALATELDSIDKKGDFASKSMDTLSVATRQLAGYMAGVVTVGAAINKMDAYTGMRNRLKLVTDSQTNLNRAMSDTFSIAQKSYQAWDSVIQVYQRFSDNAKTLKINMTQTAQLTETVSKAVAISGASTQAAEAALTQFGQALASGVLRGEELNSILEQTPGLAKAIAQGMGITVGQLRSVAAEGKITGDVLVSALTKSKASVDELFSRTDITIGQSLTLLNNEVTKFIGGAGEASGAANVMASSIKVLGENLSTIADVAVLGGVAALTKAIITKTTAIYSSVAASSVLKAADLAQKQDALAIATAKLNEAKAHLANVQATNAETQAKFGATAANARYKLASDAVTQAVVAQTAAQKALNTTTSFASKAFGLVGGWTGVLTLGVTALAAGYMYMKNRTAEATAKLEEQTKVASKTKDELLALQGVQKKGAINDLQDSFKGQNEELKKLNYQFNAHVIALQNDYKFSAEIRDISNQVREGIISQEEAIKRLNKLDFIDPKQLQQLENDNELYQKKSGVVLKVQEALKVYGINVKLAGNENSNAEAKIRGTNNALNEQGTAADQAKKKLEDLRKSYAQKNLDTDFELINIKSHGLDMGKALAEFYDANKIPKTRSLTNEEWAIFQKYFNKNQELKKLEDDITESKRLQTRELSKQYKYRQAEEKLLAKAYSDVSKSGLGAYAESKGIPANVIAGLYMQESKAGTDLKSHTGALGPWQTTSGYRKDNQISMTDNNDFLKVGKIVVDNIAKEFAKSGSLKQAILSHNAGSAGAAQFMANGSVNGKSARKAEIAGYLPKIDKWAAWGSGKKGGLLDSNSSGKDYQDLLKDQAKLRLQLENDVANEVTKIRNDLAKKLEDVDKANFTPERSKEIKAELTSRADNDIAIAEYALKTKLDDYAAYQKSEEELLIDSFNKKKFYASRDLEMSRSDRDKAVQLLDDQLKQELALLQLAQEQRLFQAKQFLYSEIDAMRERYRLEREEILLNTSITEEEQQKRIALMKSEEQLAVLDKATQYSREWDGTYADMTGNSAQYRLREDMLSRSAQSTNLAGAQDAALDIQAQDPNANLEEIAAKREEIWQAHHDRMKLIEQQYQVDSATLQMSYGEQIAGSFASMFKGILGESSGAYRTMYAMQQGFAITQAGINMWSSASGAYNETPGTIWQKMAAAAKAVMDQGTFLAMIQSITPQGFATGGKIYGAGTTTSDSIPIMASNKEFMIKASSAEKIGTDTLNYINRTGEIPYQEQRQFDAIQAKSNNVSVQPIVNVYTLPGTTAEVTTNADGSLDVRIREIARSEVRRGFDNLNNPNSYEHKQITRNTTAKTAR